MKILQKVCVARHAKVIVEHEGQHFRITLNYNIGGFSFATSSEIKRGVWLHVQPIEVSEVNGVFIMTQYRPFEGYRQLISEEKRYSHTRFLGFYADHLINEKTLLESKQVMGMITRTLEAE